MKREKLVKVVVLGERHVGKTQLIEILTGYNLNTKTTANVPFASINIGGRPMHFLMLSLSYS
jgi:GTPase SAR1 family protein